MVEIEETADSSASDDLARSFRSLVGKQDRVVLPLVRALGMIMLDELNWVL